MIDWGPRALKAQNEQIKDRLKYVSEDAAKVGEEYKRLEVQLASSAPNKEELLATGAKVNAALTKLSKANNYPSSSDLELLVSKIRSFSGTQFDVAGGGKNDGALEYFDRLVKPALTKAGWVHIDWVWEPSWDGDTFQLPPWSAETKRHYGLVPGVSNVIVRAAMHGGPNAAADELVSALNQIGIPATKEYATGANSNRNAVHILVGHQA
jgi:hypothetical protein